MKKIKYLSLIFCLLMLSSIITLTTQASSSQMVQLASHGSIVYTQEQIFDLQIKRQFFTGYLGLSPAEYAQISDMWVGHYNRLWEVPQIHSIRPDQICLLYRNIREIWLPTHAEYLESEYNLFVDNGWLLKNAGGNYVVLAGGYSHMIDVGNADYQVWLANWMLNYLDEYGADGVYLDNCLPHWELSYGADSIPINPRTGSAWESQEYTEALKELVATIKEQIGSKIVFGNVLYSGKKFWRDSYHRFLVDFILNSKIDGVLDEGWISRHSLADWYPEDDWLKGVDEAVWINDNFLSKGNKQFMTISENAGMHYPIDVTALPPGVTKEQYVTYCYASQLLAATYDGNYINFGQYMREDFPQSLFQIKLGNPIGSYYVITDTHLYVRDFSKGKVIVNPTSNEFIANLGDNYITLEGSTVTSIAVPGHTALILRNS